MTDINKISDQSISLRPKARLLKTLGEELISSETIALIELVKNAYDADAKNVLIKFSGDIKVGAGSVTIFDDGHGMDMGVIRNSWMIIAAPTKKNNTKSKSGKRRVLGEKGIGRFASSRLANELELVTRIPGKDAEIYSLFDWSQFDDDEKFLDQIEFLTEERKAEDIVEGWELSKYQKSDGRYKPQGTVLRMNSLKHDWEKSDFDQLQRGLSRLISPFSPDSKFNIFVDCPTSVGDITTKIEPPGIIQYPHYTVKGSVKENGEFSFIVMVESTGETHNQEGYFYAQFIHGVWKLVPRESAISDLSSENLRTIKCGPFSFELRVWDRDDLGNVIQKIGGGINSIRKDLDSIAGINIYRDGFRVLPYGEPNNDWLRLDIRRVQFPTKKLSNNQVTGYIAITADDNPALHDRSNREGLDNNTEYSDLHGIMILILTDLESIRFVAKKKDRNPGDNEAGQRGLFEEPDFGAIKDSIRDDRLGINETIKMVAKVEGDWKKQIKNFQNVLSQYHALATLGGIIDKVLHDGRQPLAKIQTEAGLGKEFIEDLIAKEGEEICLNKIDADQLNTGFYKIVGQASILRDVFRRVEPFGGRKRGRPKKYYIEDVIKDVFSIYKKELAENKIDIDIPDTDTLVSIDVTELSEIFTNLIVNSIYWLGMVPKDARCIRVLISRLDDGGLEILFYDSGPGIPSKYKEHIFDPWFSTRPDGHGLGLCLVGEIVKDFYNGSVELMDSGEKRGAAFRIILRKRV